LAVSANADEGVQRAGPLSAERKRRFGQSELQHQAKGGPTAGPQEITAVRVAGGQGHCASPNVVAASLIAVRIRP
jgi:hypothetical protein